MRNRMISENPPQGLKFYTYNNIKFNRTDTFDIKTGWSAVESNPNITFSTNAIQINSDNLSASNSSWALTDENDNILIAVNQSGSVLNTITFDFNNKRSGINYKY